MKKLSELRQKIDRIDEKLVLQLAARAKLVRQIGALKRAHGVETHDPSREASHLAKLLDSQNESDYIERIFAAIFRASRALQR